jgi:Outer membrane protein beta-barrel domain
MKKVLLVSLAMFLAVSVAFSQFGIKGGINIGRFGGTDNSLNPADLDPSLAGLPKVDPTARVGLTGGISYKIGLIAGLSIQPEGVYVQKGSIYEIPLSATVGGGSAKLTFKLDYIDVPILVKFNLPIPMVSPYIEGGVSYGFLLSAKLKAEGPGGSSESDIKDSTPKKDFSIIVGVGVELLILDVNARYVLGQTKLAKDANGNDMNIYNRGIVITAGLRF